ncbi:MAG TPA: lysylphosphatidylglycerol synthase domain-containing protein [Mycobacteriales bacterium]|nr:lysylphosphatidylglycerol synthase domain-containing protein [Mycobacteriales bacterium]
MAAQRGTTLRQVRANFAAWFAGHHRHVTPTGMFATVLVGAALAAAAFAGVGWFAGFGAISALTRNADWAWLPLAVAFIAVSHFGYALAYREVLSSRGGPTVSFGQVGASVLAGFGMLTPRAGFTLDQNVMCEHGLSVPAARGRVMTLGMLEYGLLAPAAFVCAVVLFVENFPARGGVLISWLVGVPVGAAIVGILFLVRRRLPLTGWLWNALRRSLDAISAMLRIVVSSRAGLVAAGGMALYWAADIAALGACLVVVRHSVPVSVLIVGYATGYALTRRSLPFAGAGAAEALMPIAMHWMTVPLATAVLAVFAYRLCNVWLPLGPAAWCMRRLRVSTPALAT